MLLRRALAVALLCVAPAQVWAQSTPSQIPGIGSAYPDSTKNGSSPWTPSVDQWNSLTKFKQDVGGGSGTINVTSVGMASGGQDNSPLLPALMSAISPPTIAGGYDVLFPGNPGKAITVYYFSNSLSLSRNANYRCSGPPSLISSVEIAFAPGVEGVVQESPGYSIDGGYGGGSFNNCSITSLGNGSANTTPNSNSITSVAMAVDPGNQLTPSTWHVGDGIVITPSVGGLGAYYPGTIAGAVVAPGAYISNVSGSTLTLASGYTTSPQLFGYANVAFTETSTNNFAVGDTIQVGNNTFTAAASGTAAGTFQIGANFAAAASNLVSAINTNASGAAWGAPLTTPNISAQIFNTMTYNSIVFIDLALGAGGNSFPSVYTPASVVAGTFPQATFIGGYVTAENQVSILQLPASLKFTVQTTIGSNSVVVTAGPRLLIPGEVVVSDAFPFGTTIESVSGTLGNQTVIMDSAFLAGAGQNALVTHNSGSPGQMWILTTGLKRDVAATSNGNYFTHWGFGLSMPCSSNGGLNCTGSYDSQNLYELNLIGRWTSGNNTSASSSINEKFGSNYMMDYMNGGTLGEVDINVNSNSPEGGTAPYSIMGNCSNQNTSVLFGGYVAGDGGGCAAPVGLIPPTTNSPWLVVGPQSGYPAGSSAISSGSLIDPWQAVNGTNCVGLNNSAYYVFDFSFDKCVTAWGLHWDTTALSWELSYNVTQLAQVDVSTSQGFVGYGGYGGATIGFPPGILLNSAENIAGWAAGSRLLCMSATIPTGTWHKQGDACFNTGASAGGPAGWVDVANGANFAPFGVVSTFSGTKTAGSCVFTIVNGVITNVTGC